MSKLVAKQILSQSPAAATVSELFSKLMALEMQQDSQVHGLHFKVKFSELGGKSITKGEPINISSCYGGTSEILVVSDAANN